MSSAFDEPDTAANKKLRHPAPDVIDQRQQYIDPAGKHRADVNPPAEDAMKQPRAGGGGAQAQGPNRDAPSYPRPPLPEQTQESPGSFAGEKVSQFGANYPIKRPTQPVELASAYVMLAEPMSSLVSGATIAVTGGKPMI